MTSIDLVLAAIALLACSGLPACLLPRGSRAGRLLATLVLVCGGLLGLAGVSLSFRGTSSLELGWNLPAGSFSVAVDPLGAFFLCPVFVLPPLASIYGLGYWRQEEQETDDRRLTLSFGLLAAAMALVVLARDALLFLIAWEFMALAAYFAATAEDDKPEVRKAGWIYLVATHLGTLCLFALFALWRAATGSYALVPAATLSAAAATPLFLLALVGFGVKAGLMPLHVWLPGAHAHAPSHVSAVMSGVMLKMGIYGIVRVTGLLPEIAPWMGAALLAAGAVSGIAGIAYALGQSDLKRALAYSSIENIGIIGMGLGLALLGRALGRPAWVLLGLGGALLHVWNHGLFKSLLFLGAGAVIHATGTREIEGLGGLGRRMPLTALLFTLGALAIAGLPPLNGFAGEWLLSLGFFDTLRAAGPPGVSAAALGAVALATIGALSVACFVRLTGAVFLGEPRSAAVEDARDPSPALLLPMAALAAACLVLGILPPLASPLLESAFGAWLPAGAATAGLAMPRIAELAPLGWIGALGAGLLALTGLLALVAWITRRRGGIPRRGTWDCGYAAPGARMEYTASSFGASLVGLFSFLLFPTRKGPAVEGNFPAPARASTRVPDLVLDRAIRPLLRRGRGQLSRIRIFQQGQTQLYLLYILVIALVLLLAGGVGVPSW